MKKLIIITLALFVFSKGANAQNIHQEKMKVFKAWEGFWQGEGLARMSPGEPGKSTVDERITFKLDGAVVLVEGIGKVKSPTTNSDSVVHQALGILSYDAQNSQYRFKTYLADGKSQDAWFSVLSATRYQWGFDTPRGKIRYTIILDTTSSWNETGEFSADGKTWTTFFEMNLTKKQ
jgi:hypothetical protein